MIKTLIQRLKILFSSVAYRRRIWPETPKLTSRHIANCRLVEDRIRMLEEIPKHGVCAELGIWKGDFSQTILEILEPAELHLFDIDPGSMELAADRFRDEIESGTVRLHPGDSSENLHRMPDRMFDWIYIDGDHSYEGAKKDLEAARLKLKEDGLISLNDYIYFGSSDLYKYGVIEAVNEFCLTFDFEVIWLALNGRMYNDVTLRRMR